jgi:hypothetical protein
MGASNGSGVRTSIDAHPVPDVSWLNVVASLSRPFFADLRRSGSSLRRTGLVARSHRERGLN